VRAGAAVLNPLRSESEAFRLLLYVIAFFGVVIAVVLIARAI
jgi:nitrogen fixation protein FixH